MIGAEPQEIDVFLTAILTSSFLAPLSPLEVLPFSVSNQPTHTKPPYFTNFSELLETGSDKGGYENRKGRSPETLSLSRSRKKRKKKAGEENKKTGGRKATVKQKHRQQIWATLQS